MAKKTAKTLVAQINTKVVVDEKNDPTLWKKYVEILRRADDPQAGDRENSLLLCRSLGISSEMAQAHLLALAEFDRLEAEGAKVAERKSALDKNLAARQKNWATYIEAGEKYGREEERLEIEHRTLLRGWIDAQHADPRIVSGAFPQLFGGDPTTGHDYIHCGLPPEIRNILTREKERKEEEERCNQKRSRKLR
ncbi:MAG: hypothetical protein IT426_20975 [Pirellulales bacterium]|nr:hypothetical protein [Pirellulales bacterium]